jgi:hypothetical protein
MGATSLSEGVTVFGPALTACCSGSEPMRTWLHERLLGGPQTKDSLRRRRRYVPKAQEAARTFSVRLSSLKRYVNKAQRGEPLAPMKKKPGSLAKLDEKARKLLEDDLHERPFVTPFGSAAST